MVKILIADDDKEILDLLSIYMKNEGYECLLANNGLEAIHLIENHSDINLCLLDIMMPEKSGMEVLDYLRKKSLEYPVILISANQGQTDKISGLLAGADDYVTKPFQPLEVVARVKGMLRRQSIYQSSNKVDVNKDRIDLGSIIIDRRNHSVVNSDQEEIKLTVIEFDILYLMASHRGHVFSADDIMQEVWQDSSVSSTKTVMVHVSNLRNKLEEATRGEKIIQTVWGVGYKINE
ncbi:response regulator transcription factor [Facklamia hominis]|uniref:Response regulator transcription factor n=1 Tax=Facklamia hominis TaxID=178214 RepID=A0AAJ1Q5X7_9LACT|nr:response regulator transcription factor [Facklamia hominis]MDK7187409.1 response regulator transcription factor [Facklamia hominis]PKY92310.1 DNA-binding response regulator [Facklamia hominis]RYC98605.1 response regulator transcription factor [Facklamia hominis]